MSADQDVIRTLKGATLWVTFNRPESRNAMTFGMYERLADICSTAPTDGSVKAIVIHGAGGKAYDRVDWNRDGVSAWAEAMIAPGDSGGPSFVTGRDGG